MKYQSTSDDVCCAWMLYALILSANDAASVSILGIPTATVCNSLMVQCDGAVSAGLLVTSTNTSVQTRFS